VWKIPIEGNQNKIDAYMRRAKEYGI